MSRKKQPQFTFKLMSVIILVTLILSTTWTTKSIAYAQGAEKQISSTELNVTFMAPNEWDVQFNVTVPLPGYKNTNTIMLVSPEQADQFMLISFPKSQRLNLAKWLKIQRLRLPSDLQKISLDNTVFGHASVIAASAEANSLYVFIDRGRDVLEISYKSLSGFSNLVAFEKLVSTLNPNGTVDLHENQIPGFATLFSLEIESNLAPQANEDEKENLNQNESVELSDSDNPNILPAASRNLGAHYIDQVYVQYKHDGIKNPTYWNWCGAVSAAMALKYFGADTRDDVSASYDAFVNIYDSVNGNLFSRIPTYTAKFGVPAVIHYSAPTFSEIKNEIDAGRPIIMHNSLGGGHFFLIIGYNEPDQVIVHDPFGSYLWGAKNAPVVFDSSGNPVPQTKGRNVTYSISKLQSIFKNDWESFKNPVPQISSLSPSSVQAGSGTTTITITGSKFVRATVAKWNGTNLPTSYVSPTKLTVTLSASLIASGTTANISVFSPSPSGGTSNSVIFTVNNPKPTTNSLSHRVISQTGSDLTITVYGTGFVPTSKVKLNSSTLSTTYVSATQLKAVIPSASRTGVGGVTISVFNPSPAGGTSNGQILVKVDFNSHVSILSRHSNKAIDLAGGSLSDGAKIQQYTWTSSNSNQWWFMIPTGGSNEFWIISWKSLKCLDVSSTTDGTAVTQKTCHFGSKQRFIKTFVGSYYALIAMWSGDALDVRDWSTSNEAVIQQYTPTYNNNQLWYTK